MVDRLGQVLVGAGIQPGHDVLGVGHGGDEDDRRERKRGVVLEAPAHLEAVDLRHHDVEQDQVRALGRRGSQRLLAVDAVTIS